MGEEGDAPERLEDGHLDVGDSPDALLARRVLTGGNGGIPPITSRTGPRVILGAMGYSSRRGAAARCSDSPLSGREGLHSPYQMLAGENISARFVVPTVAASVDIVVHLGLDADGKRRVREIVAVPGRVEADIIEAEPIFTAREGTLARVHGMPPHLERFHAHGVDIHEVLAQSGAFPEGAGV